MAHVNPRVHDHRIREQVVRTGNPELFPELEIPRKTALSWIRRGARHVVTLDEAGWEPAHHVRMAKLEGVAMRARKAMPLTAALRVLRLLCFRYHAWVRADGSCSLDDRPSCPRSSANRLTFDEVQAIGDMVQSTQHRHMSIRGLALHAQRIGRVFAHPGTWSKLIRERGWRRPPANWSPH